VTWSRPPLRHGGGWAPPDSLGEPNPLRAPTSEDEPRFHEGRHLNIRRSSSVVGIEITPAHKCGGRFRSPVFQAVASHFPRRSVRKSPLDKEGSFQPDIQSPPQVVTRVGECSFVDPLSPRGPRGPAGRQPRWTAARRLSD